jgi:hypothetical protein
MKKEHKPMKRTVLFIATAAMALTSTLATAQPYSGYRGGDTNRYDQRYDQRDNRGAQRWQRGQRLDSRYRSRDRVVSDYQRYRLRAPPRGYNYYRTDTGDIVLALIATGIISSVIAGALTGNDNSYGYGSNGYSSYGQPGYGQPSYGQPSYGYSQPSYGYNQPSYGGGYGGGQVYRDQNGRSYTIDPSGRSVWVN